MTLAKALEVYERGIHGRCGQPLQFSTDSDARGHYEPQSTICHACAALEASEKAASDGKQPRPGLVQWVTPDAALRHAMEYPLPAQYGEEPPT